MLLHQVATEEGGAGEELLVCQDTRPTGQPILHWMAAIAICFTDAMQDRELDLWPNKLGFTAHLVPANGGINELSRAWLGPGWQVWVVR